MEIKPTHIPSFLLPPPREKKHIQMTSYWLQLRKKNVLEESWKKVQILKNVCSGPRLHGKPLATPTSSR